MRLGLQDEGVLTWTSLSFFMRLRAGDGYIQQKVNRGNMRRFRSCFVTVAVNVFAIFNVVHGLRKKSIPNGR